MIKNERQLAISRRKLSGLLESAKSAKSTTDKLVYDDLAAEVQTEIDDYLSVREGHVNVLAIESLDDLPDVLVKARIARRWTQRQLADALGVTEQQIQKDEAGGYENAQFARIAEVLDVLQFDLHGEVRPTDCGPEGWRRAGAAENLSTSITFNYDALLMHAHGSPSLNRFLTALPPKAPYQVQSGTTFRIPSGVFGTLGPDTEFKVLSTRTPYMSELPAIEAGSPS